MVLLGRYPVLDSRLRSSSSFALKRRGHSSDSHRPLTMPSRARPDPSIAQTWWLSLEKRQNWRPHLRQVYTSLEPRTGDQSSILTAKSWVSQVLVAGAIQVL